MKLCPQCPSGYHDRHTTCPTHGLLLSEILDLKPKMILRGSYRIVRKLGQGGMGTVYLAEHMLMGELRALKVLSSDLSSDSSFSSRFLQEVRTLRQVRNQNVVDCGNLERAEDDSLFFSMEFVDGPDLRDFLLDAHGPLEVSLALGIARGIAHGLGAAHAKGMIHRDIKPENILIARDGDALIPKIADFGIVATNESRSNHTRTGMTMLTMDYAAPEQWLGMPAAEIDGRADLYGLGGILFEMLTGRTAFNAENYEGWMNQHLSIAPPAPSNLRPELANWHGLDQLVLRLLAKDRKQRPRDVEELLTLLDAVCDPASTPQQIVSEVHTLHGHKDGLWSVAFSPDGRTLVSGSMDHTIRLWDVLSGRLLRTIESQGDGTISVVFSPDGRTLASGSHDQTVRLWDASTGRLLHTLQSQGSIVMHVAYSPDGRTLAASCLDRSVRLWDTSDGRLLGDLEGHSDGVIAIAFSPDGRILASGGADRTVHLWDIFAGQTLRTLYGQGPTVMSIAFSPDSKTLTAGSLNRTVKLWDLSTGLILHTMEGHTDGVISAAFSPDGRTLASASRDNTVRLWDISSGRLLHTLESHNSSVVSVAFSSDGRTLASGSNDKTIKLWDVSRLHEASVKSTSARTGSGSSR